MQYVWCLRKEKNTAAIANLSKLHNISSFLAQFLYMRSLDEADVAQYLSPHLRFLKNTAIQSAFSPAIDILEQCIEKNIPLCVWGDYDVDGICSSVIIYEVCKAHGIDICVHIPERTQGYGLNIPDICTLHTRGIGCIITVDCGISDTNAVQKIKNLGMRCIITDHHVPHETLPPADAICNPKLHDDMYQDFSGAGIAFIVAALLHSRLQKKDGIFVDMRNFLDLVALASVADLVPLSDQNRILVKNGLLVLKEARRPGIRALKEVCSIQGDAPVTAGQIGFKLAPRLNATGRISSPQKAFALLTTQCLDKARVLAKELDTLNTQRQAEEEQMYQEAYLQAKAYQQQSTLVLYAPHWHHGIIGIVASRIVEQFNKPTVIVCKDTTLLKASARSIVNLHLHETLSACSDLFVRFGGHKAAAGFSMEEHNLQFFRERFEKAVVETIGSAPYAPPLYLDGELPFSCIASHTLQEDIATLQPFGIHNAEPVFLAPVVEIVRIKHFGENQKHALLTIKDHESGITFNAKAWRQGDAFSPTDSGKYISLAYTPIVEEYNDIPQVSIKIKDWKWKEC